MFSRPNKDQTLALAGLFQSAELVNQIATKNHHDTHALYESAYSLIRLDADKTDEVYGSVAGVDLGLRTMIALFTSRPSPSTKYVYQYAVGAHQLSTKLLNLKKTRDVIHKGLEEIRDDYEGRYQEVVENDEICETLAALYSQTISYLTPRIIVQGSQKRLQDTDTVHRVRTALFAGIRSAYLWHQLGGRKWQLLFNRKDYVYIAKNILNQ